MLATICGIHQFRFETIQKRVGLDHHWRMIGGWLLALKKGSLATGTHCGGQNHLLKGNEGLEWTFLGYNWLLIGLGLGEWNEMREEGIWATNQQPMMESRKKVGVEEGKGNLMIAIWWFFHDAVKPIFLSSQNCFGNFLLSARFTAGHQFWPLHWWK